MFTVFYVLFAQTIAHFSLRKEACGDGEEKVASGPGGRGGGAQNPSSATFLTLR